MPCVCGNCSDNSYICPCLMGSTVRLILTNVVQIPVFYGNCIGTLNSYSYIKHNCVADIIFWDKYFSCLFKIWTTRQWRGLYLFFIFIKNAQNLSFLNLIFIIRKKYDKRKRTKILPISNRNTQQGCSLIWLWCLCWLIEFFYNSSFPAKSWQDSASVIHMFSGRIYFCIIQ